VAWARARGVQVGKLAECAGLPDRIFFIPGGCPLIVEFKDPGGRGVLSPAQIWHLSQLRVQGYSALVVESKSQFLAEMEAMHGKEESCQ
jgi:hypothetical protein